MGKTSEPDDPLPFRPAASGELALAFIGSIAVGAISPAILGCFWGSWSDFLGASIVCGFLGMFWGYLTVITVAAVECEHRRATMLWMFAIQSLFAMVVGRWVMLSAGA